MKDKKEKILLAGKNSSIIDDLFGQLVNDFDFLSTSMRMEDFYRHIRVFAPDLFLYCIGNESIDEFQKMYTYYEILKTEHLPLAIIGTEEACDYFVKYSKIKPPLIIKKPITAPKIREHIEIFFEDQSYVKAEMEQKAAEEKSNEEKLLEEASAAARERGEEPPEIQEERRKHVLVVDDDPMMLKLIKEHLKEQYTVATAPSGKVAMKFLESKETDLILLDYEMPVENGPAVLKKLRIEEKTKNIPVVFLTGVTDRDKISQALSLKPQGYILKPIDREKLLETIRGLIG